MSCGPIQDAAKNLAAEIAEAVEAVRKTNPMAGSITNTVTIDFVANAQLAVGGSAAMVYLPDEGEFLVRAGGATYVNMGTMFPVYEQTLPAVGRISAELKKPWVLDPVGIGIGSLRTKLLHELRQYKPAIVRGNSSEIIALAGYGMFLIASIKPLVREVLIVLMRWKQRVRQLLLSLVLRVELSLFQGRRIS